MSDWASVLLQCRRCTSTRNVLVDPAMDNEPETCNGLYWPHQTEQMIEVRRVNIAAPGSAA